MNRTEFLKTLMIMYPRSFSEDNRQAWLNAYQIVLKGDIDYKKLMEYVAKEWESTYNAPPPAWLKGYISLVVIKKEVKKDIDKGIPCPAHIKEKIEELYKDTDLNKFNN